MCYAFKDTEVIYKEGFDGHEMDFDKFVKHTSEKNFTIGKRHPPALLSNVLVPEFQNQAGDIIKEQIWIAFSGETAIKQSDINPRGHAIE